MKFKCEDCGHICELNGLITYLNDESVATIPFMIDMDESNVISYHIDSCYKEYMEKFNPTWVLKQLNEEVKTEPIDKSCPICESNETLYYYED